LSGEVGSKIPDEELLVSPGFAKPWAIFKL